MNLLLGWQPKGDHSLAVVQTGALVEVERRPADWRPGGVLESRDTMIGSGPTAGEGVFDFRYGPFTAGSPEAGVIHYHTYGERVLSAEIDLSGKHRGIERSLAGLSVTEALPRVASLCGNFTVSHTLAFCRAVEKATGAAPGESALRLRIVALELERIYNHLYVIMRLATAAAQKVLAAHLCALFEDALRLTEQYGGVRGMRGFVKPGGCNPRSVESASDAFPRLRTGVEVLRTRFARLYARSLASRNYVDRLHMTARVSASLAERESLTGASLRACGVAWDLRAAESLIETLVARTKGEADAFARMEVRAEEILDSCGIVLDQLARISGSPASAVGDERALADSSAAFGIGASESPSGTVAWMVELSGGRITTAYASSPSVFGFQTYAHAIVGNIFTDVPFALESFGLSFADAGR